MSEVAANLADVRQRIREACEAAQRDPEEVLLLAVSKTVPPERIRLGIQAGVEALGESRIQEARPKIESLGRPVPWHLVGHLQTNKARFAVRLFDMIHSVDSLRLIRELGRRAAQAEVTVEILLQVNVSGEDAKSGCAPTELPELIQTAQAEEALRLRGLMTIPPWSPDPEEARPFLRALRELRDRMETEKPGVKLPELSMGMSADLEVAVQEGATILRVGTAIFGGRS